MGTVEYSPFTSIFENKASGNIIIGSPGSGKTFFLLNVLSNAVMMKQRIFGIDPKDDLGIISEIFPDDVEYIDINNIKSGALNPFSVLNNLNTITLSSIIGIICGGLTDDQKNSITPILNDFVIKHQRNPKSISFSQVANYLYAHEDKNARTVGTILNIHRDSDYGALLFAEDEEDYKKNALKFSEKSKIISLHGMDLPKANAKSITEEQQFNSAIVFIVCKMLRQLLVKNGYPTLLTIDEAHIVYQNDDFAKMIDDFLVMGRSLNCPTILASQSTSHYPEGIEQFTSSKFCFKSAERDANQFLNKFMSTDTSSSNSSDFTKIAAKINNFQTGDAFFIDSRNRAGFMHVVSSFGDDVTSNPLMKKRKKMNG